MQWKVRLVLPVMLLAVTSACFSQNNISIKKDKHLLKVIQQNFTDAARQYKILKQQLPAGKFPKTYFPLTGNYEWSDASWWCSGFYPGTLFYLYEQTHDTVLYHEAIRMLSLLKNQAFNTGTHDLGFMMYCSFGNANRIAPQPEYRETLLNSARSLATRFNPTIGCIKSWDSKEGDFLVIIDNMMNLALLCWATKATGDSSFYRIAVTHANTTLQHHFRTDNSSYHVINYNTLTGTVTRKQTAQGAADESAWSRGQSWGLYGFTEMFRETKDSIYLQQANNIASFILNHPNLPADHIPYWDYNAPGIPNALRDASSAAIMASALLELCRYTDAVSAKKYFSAAETILRTLSGKKYKATPGTNGGFILQHGVGHHPQQTEIDVPLTYADYYFIEAMKRYKEW